MNSTIAPIALSDTIKTKMHGLNRKATAIIAAAGLTLSAASGLAVSDYINASSVYKQIEVLKTGLVKSGLDKDTIAEADKTINEGIEKDSKWSDSMTKRAVKKLISWETSLELWAAKNAYIQGLIEGLSGKGLGLDKAPKENRPKAPTGEIKIIDVKAVNTQPSSIDIRI